MGESNSGNWWGRWRQAFVDVKDKVSSYVLAATEIPDPQSKTSRNKYPGFVGLASIPWLHSNPERSFSAGVVFSSTSPQGVSLDRTALMTGNSKICSLFKQFEINSSSCGLVSILQPATDYWTFLCGQTRRCNALQIENISENNFSKENLYFNRNTSTQTDSPTDQVSKYEQNGSSSSFVGIDGFSFELIFQTQMVLEIAYLLRHQTIWVNSHPTSLSGRFSQIITVLPIIYFIICKTALATKCSNSTRNHSASPSVLSGFLSSCTQNIGNHLIRDNGKRLQVPLTTPISQILASSSSTMQAFESAAKLKIPWDSTITVRVFFASDRIFASISREKIADGDEAANVHTMDLLVDPLYSNPFDYGQRIQAAPPLISNIEQRRASELVVGTGQAVPENKQKQKQRKRFSGRKCLASVLTIGAVCCVGLIVGRLAQRRNRKDM